MSEACRRIILKPDGLGEDQLSQLGSLLAAAVELQNRLADRSPHVLRFVGDIQQTERTFFVEHESADPFPVAELFDPDSATAEEQVLLRIAAATLDALRVVHETPGPRPVVHGGLCPGVLLTTADGVVKLADVGFAPAVCTALGAESYLNLAVSPRTEGSQEYAGTGVWEVLPRQTFDRSDRLCSFIDPEKYASRMHQSFEPKSDIIAAGFILHLLAEHRHPYFHDDPEAHRMIEMAEYMAMGTATRARRKELRESSDPAVRRWCDLVARMIDRLPQNRPAAAALAEEFKPHEGPVTLDKLPDRKVEVVVEESPEQAAERERLAREWLAVLQEAVTAGEWNVVERRLADRPRIPKGLEDLLAQVADVENQVRYRRQLVEQLRRSVEILAAGNIAEARRMAGQVELETDHPDLVEEARRLRERIAEQERRLLEQQARIEQARGRADGLLADAEQKFKHDTQDSLQQAEDQVVQAMAIPELSPPQRERGEKLLASIGQRLSELAAEAQRRAAALAMAQGDLRESRDLLVAGRFKKAEEKARPHIDSAFDDVQQEAKGIIADIANALGRYRSGLRRQLETAEGHLRHGRLREAIEAARVVDKDEYADDALRTEARYTLNAAQEAMGEIDRARLKAVADRDQALAGLREGDLEGARSYAQDVLDNGQADVDARADAERVLAVLPEFDAGKMLMADEDFPGAMEAFESILRPREAALWPPARVAAERLRDIAGQARKNKLVDSIHRHLAHRAQREEAAAEVSVVAPDESLPASAPGWVLTTLSSFETFLQDCAVTSKPAQSGKTLSLGDRLGEKYEVLEFLGRGGMGEVYRARDLSLDREVALKLAAPAAESGPLADALRNEAKAIAALTHPHIIHINSFDVIDDRPCFDTNYIRGHDLDQYASQNEISWREMAEILIPIAEALAYAHKRGVLHRDVKPQNIYLGERPGDGPWLIDFGLARMRSLCGGRTNMGLCGTPGFIAPEVITSMGEDVDQRADIFALGCVLYGLLTKETPFRRGDLSQTPSSSSASRMLLNTLRSQTIPLINAAPKSPETLRRICDRAMAPEPQDRYQDAGEVARDLRRFLLELDREEAESKLAQARAHYESRPRKEPAEIGVLDECAALAEDAGRVAVEAQRRCEHVAGSTDETLSRAIEDLRGRAARLVEEAQRQKQQIVESQETARLQLQAAGDRATAGRFRAALAASRNVLANPYVPDLHEQARKVADEAGEHVRAATRKAVKLGGIATGSLAVLLGVCWYAFLMPLSPKILRAPKDVLVNVGEAVTFDVEATGRPKPAYQWQRKLDGVWTNLSGKTQASLSISPVRPEDAGEYQCVVGNGHGSDLKVLAALRLAEQAPLAHYTVVATNQGEGEVDVSPQADRYVQGAQIILTAKAAMGWRFDHWEGDLTGAEVQTSLVVDANKSVTAVFMQTAIMHALSLGKQGEGLVEATPPGGRHEKGARVSLAAKPFAGWRFDHWEGDLTGTNDRADLTMDGDKTVTAVFVVAPPTYALLLSKQGEGLIDVAPPGERQMQGTGVTLTAKAAKGWRFDHWLGDVTGTEAQTKLVMDKDRSVTAVFVKDLPMYSLSLSSQGDGQVDVVPPGGRYVQGTEVTITASPATGWRFDRWETDTAVQGNPARFKMDADRSLQAVFVQIGWPKFSEPAVDEIKKLLVGGQAGTSPLRGYNPEWIRLTNESGKLSLTLSYPGYGLMLERPLVPIPFPTTGWPAEPAQQPAKAAATITAAFQQAANADPGLNSLLKYLAFWGERQALENDLLKELSPGTDGPVSLGLDKLSGQSGYLTRLARIKWMSVDVPDAPAVADWTQRLQDTLEKNRNVDEIPIQIRPTRFIEYFWGPQSVHAIYWFANQPGSVTVWYTRLGGAAELGAQLKDLLAKKTTSPSLGERLVSRIIGQSGAGTPKFFEVTNPNKSFGIALAPDGPLCFISLFGLPFEPLAIDISVPDAAQISDVPKRLTGTITQLDALYAGVFSTAHTAAWVLASLAPPPPPDKTLPPSQLWEVPAEMITSQGTVGEASAQQQLAPAQAVRDFGRVFHADMVCFRSDLVPVAAAVRQGITSVDKRFNRGGEVFDAGFITPRIDDSQTAWFALITNPVESSR